MAKRKAAAEEGGPVIDEGFRRLIPPLADNEYDRLEASIQAEGCREPVVLWSQGGLLLDGHNRVAICETYGIEYRTTTLDFPDRTAAELWIIRNQLARRNLSEIDRIALAREEEKRLKPDGDAAKQEGRRKGGKTAGRGRPKSNDSLWAKLPTSKVNTRREAAKTAGVGERTYDAGKLILDAEAKGEIPAETVEKVRRGEAAIHRVAKDIKETRPGDRRRHVQRPFRRLARRRAGVDLITNN